ncbi:MAG TPA: hypothetical protein VGG35_26475 [Streptosporangiaceae bacterium]|jgi:hypothetical protein
MSDGVRYVVEREPVRRGDLRSLQGRLDERARQGWTLVNVSYALDSSNDGVVFMAWSHPYDWAPGRPG